MKCTQCGYFNLPSALTCGRCGMDLAHPTARAGGSLQESLYPPRARDRTLRDQVQMRVRLPSLPKPAPLPPLRATLRPWLIMTAALLPGAGHFLLGDRRRGIRLLAAAAMGLGLSCLLLHSWISNMLLWGLLGLVGFSVWDVTDRTFSPAAANPESQYYRRMRIGFLSAGTVAGTLASLYWLAGQWYPLYHLTNEQTAPVLRAGDDVLAERLTQPLSSLKRGDIVVARPGNYPIIERVLGLPGDHVTFTGGKLFINGIRANRQTLPLSRDSLGTTAAFDTIVMPGEIYIWIMPTGRYQEEGGSGVPSGSFGALEANEIEGRLLAILGPPPRRRLFH